MIEIISNGSKWIGQEPDSVDVLINVLARHPLSRIHGPFIRIEHGNTVRFFGNFCDLSHVFNIRTDDPDVISRLHDAIARNMKSAAYRSQNHGVKHGHGIRTRPERLWWNEPVTAREATIRLHVGYHDWIKTRPAKSE